MKYKKLKCVIKKPKIESLRSKSKLIKLDLWDLLFLLIAFVLVIPDGIGNISSLAEKLFYRWGLYVIYIVILFVFGITFYRNGTVTKIFIFFCLFVAATVFILFFRGHSFSAWFYAFSPCLFVVLFAEANRNKLDKIVLHFLLVLEFWIYINFILMLLYPGGMYYLESNNSYLNWILGYKSSLQYYVLPGITFSWLNMKYRNQKLRYFLLLAISWASTIISANSMLLVGLALFTVFQFSRLWNLKKIFSIWLYYGIDIVANVVIVFFLTWFSNTSLGINLFLLLGKNATISSRASIIWPITINYIREHLLWGNGIYISKARVSMYRGFLAFIHSHNHLMEIMFIGGIFLLGVYAILHIQIGKSLRESSDTGASKILSISILTLYLMMVVEVFTRIVAGPIWLILYLAGNCGLVHKAFLRRPDCTYED